MTKIITKVSPALEREVLKKAKQLIGDGETEGVLNQILYGTDVIVYIDKEPKKFLNVFSSETDPDLLGKMIYLGSEK